VEGTDALEWSAPEVVDRRVTGSVAADVYAVGAVVWTLLAGHSPYRLTDGDNSWRAVSARILHSAPPSLGRPDVPPGLADLLAACLSKDPGSRPATAYDVAVLLQQVEAAAGLPTTPLQVSGDPRGPAPAVDPGPDRRGVEAAAEQSPAPEQPRRRAWVGAAAVGAVLVLVVVLLVVWHLGSNPAARNGLPVGPPTTRFSETPGVVPRPIVTARRESAGQVLFRWHAADAPVAGDAFAWQVAHRPPQLTNATTTTVHSPSRVCVRVRLERNGEPPSGWSHACA
jgi:hypothetical protein